MRLKRAIIFGISVLMMFSLLAIILTGCGSSTSSAVEVTIGLTAPLTGSGAAYGQDVRDGIDMAMQKVNDAGGITIGGTTYKFKLESADDQMVPDLAATNANRFVLEDGINIIWDPTANTIAPLLQKNTTAGEEFLIMAYSSVPLYATAPNKYLITMPPPFSVYFKPFIQMAMAHGWMKMAMMQTDFSAYLTAALAANPDVIFCGGPSEPTGLLIEQARARGYTGGFIVIDQAKLDVIADEIGMDKLEGAIGVLPIAMGANLWPYLNTFIDDFQAKYGRPATWESAINYTAFHILTQAMINANSVDDLDAIRAGFATNDASVTSGDEYPVGYSGINPDTGALFMPGTPAEVKDGQFVEGQRVDWWLSS
jgi:branched-chain amino acid transport system substrate-binding protein